MMDKKLTDDEYRVYKIIQSKMPDWVSPTRIGMSIGGITLGGLQRHSSWASPICVRLVGRAIIQRTSTGQYATIRQYDPCYGCPDYTSTCIPCEMIVEFVYFVVIIIKL